MPAATEELPAFVEERCETLLHDRTALATFATHGSASVEAQSGYHRALQTTHGARFELILGSHTFNKEGVLAPEFVPGQAFDRTRRVRVWKLEEKKTDVNLAVRMYRDACQGR